jgi:hypothetical protein
VPFDPETPKTMPVGYNVLGATCGGPVPLLANVAKNAQFNEFFTATDALGNPTRFSASPNGTVLIGQQGDGNGLRRGYPAAEYGDWTVRWRGLPGELYLGGSDVRRADRAGDLGRRHPDPRLHVHPDAQLLPVGLPLVERRARRPGRLDHDGHRDRRLRPGIDAANPPTFHPKALAKLPRGGSIRFMDALNTGGGSMRDRATTSPRTGSATSSRCGG